MTRELDQSSKQQVDPLVRLPILSCLMRLKPLLSRIAVAQLVLLLSTATVTASAEEISVAASDQPNKFSIELGPDLFTNPPTWVMDLGSARAGGDQDIILAVRNRSGMAVTIGEFVPTCPCLVTDADQQVLKADESKLVKLQWYVGPVHGPRGLSISVSFAGADGRMCKAHIITQAIVTDVVDCDYHARAVSFGRITIDAPPAELSETLTFQKTPFKMWDRAFVAKGSAVVDPLITSDQDVYTIVFRANVPAIIAGRRLGAFFDELTIGFSDKGAILAEDLRYHITGVLVNPRYNLSPSQAFWGEFTRDGDGRAIPEKVASSKTATVTGFTVTKVTPEKTYFYYHGRISTSETSPFAIQVTPDDVSHSTRLTITRAVDEKSVTSKLRKSEKAYSLFIVDGVDNQQTPPQLISFNLPIFFSVPE